MDQLFIVNIFIFKYKNNLANKLIIFGGMNNSNYIGSSLMIFNLDSHLNPSLYKNKYFKFDAKTRKSFPGRPKTKSVFPNFNLPPIK